MKKKILNSVLILIILLAQISFSFASTDTFERDASNNYGVTKNIDMTSLRIEKAKETPLVNEEEKIYDFADLFTEEEEEALYKNAKQFIGECNLDIVIVTINENNKGSAMEYADDFYDYNSFGTGEKDSGILFLIDMYNRKLWISTTGKAISIYNSEIDPILDDCIVPMKNSEYFKCANTFITSSKESYKSVKRGKWLGGFTFAIIISLAVPTIFCLVKKSKHKAIKLATNANTYLEKESVNIIKSRDNFVRTYTSRVARVESSSSSGGGSHSGSSGASHGGGGRSF